jgi:hypothetical protein
MNLACCCTLLALGQCDASGLELRVGSAVVEPEAASLTIPVAIHGVERPFPDIFALGLQWDPAVLALRAVRTPDNIAQNPFHSWDQEPDEGLARVLHLGSSELEASHVPIDARAVLVWLDFDVLARRDSIVRVNPSTSRERTPWWYTQVYYCGEMWTFREEDGRQRVDGDVVFRKAPPTFLRGDVDGNGHLNLTDVIRTLAFLFEGKARLDCQDAADADDDGQLTITDAVYLGRRLFLAGPPPLPPFPAAGPDPTADALPCERSVP